MATEPELIAAWQWPAAELGIGVTSPFVIGDEDFPFYVPLFGRSAGALPIWIGDERPRHDAEANGFFISLLNPQVYCRRDRALFVETLVDWGWFGAPHGAPKWYQEVVSAERDRSGTKP
jgi:hypothetical protein